MSTEHPPQQKYYKIKGKYEVNSYHLSMTGIKPAFQLLIKYIY